MLSGIVERLRGLRVGQSWSLLLKAGFSVDLEQVLRHHYPQGTKDLLGPNLVTHPDDNEVIVDKGSVSTDLSANYLGWPSLTLLCGMDLARVRRWERWECGEL